MAPAPQAAPPGPASDLAAAGPVTSELAAAGPRTGAPDPAALVAVRPRLTSGALAARLAMPLADAAALATAAGMTSLAGVAGMGGGGWLIAGYPAVVFLVLSGLGLHRLRICLRTADQAGRIVVAAALPALALLPWVPPRTVWLLVAASAALLIITRAVTLAALRAAHRRGRLTERAVLAGAGPEAQQLARLLGEHPELGLRLQGGPDRTLPGGHWRDPAAAGTRPPAPGMTGDLLAAVAQHGISRVIVCPPDGEPEEQAVMLRALRACGVDTCVLPRQPGLAAAVPTGCLDEIWGVPLIPLRRGPRLAGRAVKRSFDIIAATLLLILAAPVIAAGAAAVRLRLRRPALFRQVRVVGGGRQAEIVKLRTLGQHTDPDTSWTVPPAQCSGLGRFLRMTHIDELPQLASVLRGDMSLVGPRPERPHFARQFSQAIPGYPGRQRMPAGMTGWAQVHGLNGDTSISDRARFDNFYIEHWSCWLDLTILARTVTSTAADVVGRRGGQ